jgi:uncharacterized protein
MELTRVERWMLANQFRILEILVPDERDYYRRGREALQEGYEREYAQLAQHIYPEKDCMSADACREVFDILLMFADLKDAQADGIIAQTDLDPLYMRFWGFDGNSESNQLGYCRYLVEDRQNTRFHRLDRGDDFNSHMPALDGYRRMLAVWRQRRPGDRLTKEDIIAIASARPDPTSEVARAMRDPGPRH